MTGKTYIAFVISFYLVLWTICESTTTNEARKRIIRQSKVPPSADHSNELGSRFGDAENSPFIPTPKLKCSCEYVRDYVESPIPTRKHMVELEIVEHVGADQETDSTKPVGIRKPETNVETESPQGQATK